MTPPLIKTVSFRGLYTVVSSLKSNIFGLILFPGDVIPLKPSSLDVSKHPLHPPFTAKDIVQVVNQRSASGNDGFVTEFEVIMNIISLPSFGILKIVCLNDRFKSHVTGHSESEESYNAHCILFQCSLQFNSCFFFVCY